MEQKIIEFCHKHKESVFSGVMFCFFMLVIIFSKDIKLLVVNTTVDARFWPRIIGVGGCILSVILFLESIFEEKNGIETTTEQDSHADKIRSIKTLILMFLYILGLDYLGFIIMTIVYLFFQFSVLTPKEERKYIRFIVIDIVFTLIVFAVFRFGFQMMLPTGRLFAVLGV